MENFEFSLKDWWNKIDKYILISTIFLISIGIILVFSASQLIINKQNFSENFLFKKHLLFSLVGFLTILAVSNFSIKYIILTSILIFLIAVILSIFAKFFTETKGASRWIKIYNFSIQPSELLKPSFIILSSLFLSRYKNKQDNSLIINIVFLAIISLVLLIQPDFGMFVLIFIVWFIQILMTKISIKIISMISSFFFFLILLAIIFLDHVRFRFENFFYNIGDNYQILKSLKAFSSGGIFGKGIGGGEISKNLPDVHSDFIFSLAGEELGFLAAIVILLIYLFIFSRIYYLLKDEKNFFVFVATTGLSNILMFQTLINISSSLNILPTKGMTLPFISYGGSSVLSCSILIGFILALTKKKNE